MIYSAFSPDEKIVRYVCEKHRDYYSALGYQIYYSAKTLGKKCSICQHNQRFLSSSRREESED